MAGRRGRPVLGEADQTALLACRVPKTVADAVQRVAAANYESPAAYVRRVLVERLRAEGVLPQVPPQGGAQ